LANRSVAAETELCPDLWPTVSMQPDERGRSRVADSHTNVI
jgi:hypothetical protein